MTGQNIANANTEGYNRRDAQLAEVSATQGDILSVSDQAGLGVRVENIRRAFDDLIVSKPTPQILHLRTLGPQMKITVS